MRIAYCDDEKVQGIYVKELTTEWEKEGNGRCELKIYGSAEEMLFENVDFFPFDFIILDIELDRMNGIELAKNIRKVDKNVIIAFLSNSREYVFDGYEVQAVRYLMKPITREQLFPLLDMVKENSGKEKQYIIVGGVGEKIKLELDDILYVEASGHYVSIYTEKTSYEVKMNMNEITNELNDSFISTHRSYAVNLHHVERITKSECHLKGGHSVPVSRGAYKKVNQEFIIYYKGGGLE
ncbi:DNA-binding response regulator [Anaerocolumna cellulosilytica]|uniref:Stage 0 sporulation protein A homolog n=1 Tax=Anaerocolumna cellulosilytica TaxID=433286 RepID=A0A6S6R112_9FIRM|nr:LytTR family DNA-binding domain-containing protein [Anaerocolumna cellulosilytica]MBB5197570.1 DNA-binding LytR/AlgR family response regulator [Anaerocolumna cellulosilytica]BCJ96594.1 DNA-binding response regulator [Anaerocolumna cellulosilytica]